MDREPLPDEQEMAPGDVARRALSGAVLLGARGVVLRALGLVGNIALARMLVPEQFGIVAFGATFLTFAGFLSDAGLAAGLIRRPEPPTRRELEAVLALQLAGTAAVAVLVALIGAPFGLIGQVTAVMVASLPIGGLRTPGTIVLERRLDYRPLAFVEVVDSVAYFGWAIGTVALGWGVWGLATAMLARALGGTVTMLLVSPVRSLRPRWDVSAVRTVLRFGVQYQLVSFANVLRDEGLNLGTAALVGVHVLGLWSLSEKLLVVPFLLFTSLWRVSFPAMSRLVSSGVDVRETIRRGISLGLVMTGALLVPLVAAADVGVAALFGEKWAPAAAVIPWASAGLMFSGPVSTAAAGYLYAVGDAGRVLRSLLYQTAARFAVVFPLLPLIGVQAHGVGWLVACVVETVVLARGVRRHLDVPLYPRLVAPTLVAFVAAAAGWSLSHAMGESVLSALTAAGVSLVVYGAGLALVQRAALRDAWLLAGRGRAKAA
ncbi:MAG TPA: oligosaccharide flippase family protein [Mycobacteriales bacterium]|jgi:O-antigen/teichoic acid export membrane protein